MNEEMRTIARERENPSFDVRELTHALFGGPQATALKVGHPHLQVNPLIVAVC
jgi:hypothetical protein